MAEPVLIRGSPCFPHDSRGPTSDHGADLRPRPKVGPNRDCIAAIQTSDYSAVMGSFNTALFEALLSIGVSADRARAAVDLLERAIDERYSRHVPETTTKLDLVESENRLTASVGKVRNELVDTEKRLTSSIVEVKNDLVVTEKRIDARFSLVQERLLSMQLDAEKEFRRIDQRIAETRIELTRWMLAALTAQTAIIAAVVKLA